MNSLDRLRRRFLQGGATLVLAPFFRRLARAAEPPPRRLILFNTSNGTIGPAYWPTRASDTDFTLGPILTPLAPLRDRLLVLQGFDMASARADKPVGEAHYNPVVHALTGGRQPSGAFHPSLDQVVAAGPPVIT